MKEIPSPQGAQSNYGSSNGAPIAVWGVAPGATLIPLRVSRSVVPVRSMKQSLIEMSKIHLAAGANSVYHFTNPSLEIKSKDELKLLDNVSFEPQRATIFTVHVMGGCRMGASETDAASVNIAASAYYSSEATWSSIQYDGVSVDHPEILTNPKPPWRPNGPRPIEP